MALLLIAPWLVLEGWATIGILFEDSRDNEAWVYVAFGAPFWLAALLCVAAALALLLHATTRSPQRSTSRST